jgi:hypothetical protein
MGLVDATLHGATKVVNATTAAAGAVSGAAVSGVVGGVRGTVDGVLSGVSSGSRSTPAAALTLAVVGAAGLVEWPIVLAVGGAALVVRQLTRPPEATSTGGGLRSVPTRSTASADRGSTRRSTSAASRTTPTPSKSAPRVAKSAPRAAKSASKAARSAARKAAPRRSQPSS